RPFSLKRVFRPFGHSYAAERRRRRLASSRERVGATKDVSLEAWRLAPGRRRPPSVSGPRSDPPRQRLSEETASPGRLTTAAPPEASPIELVAMRAQTELLHVPTRRACR